MVCRIIRQAHQEYLEEILNVNCPDTSPSHRPNTKKLYSLLKHSKQDSATIPPLKFQNKLHYEECSKASVLNKQFQSVFSPKSPLSLASLCKMKLQDISDTDGSPAGQDPNKYPRMPDINICANGIEKLLSKLNRHKACGPDKVKPIILKTLSKELSPIIKLIFQKFRCFVWISQNKSEGFSICQ